VQSAVIYRKAGSGLSSAAAVSQVLLFALIDEHEVALPIPTARVGSDLAGGSSRQIHHYEQEGLHWRRAETKACHEKK